MKVDHGRLVIGNQERCGSDCTPINLNLCIREIGGSSGLWDQEKEGYTSSLTVSDIPEYWSYYTSIGGIVAVALTAKGDLEGE